MSKIIDFKEISDDARFERFIEDLLSALGWKIIFGAGKGPDGGRDILAAKDETTIVGRTYTKKYVFQCKHFAQSDKAVSPSALGEFQLVPTQHNADGWLLATSTRVSSDSVAKIDAARRMFPGKDYDRWDAEFIEKLLIDTDACRGLLKQYFPLSYARLNGTLIPSRLEVREILKHLFKDQPDYEKFFFYNDETENNLLAEAVSLRISLEHIRNLSTDATLHQEFIEIWSKILRRGSVKGSALLLFRGINRLSDFLKRGLPAPERNNLIASELSQHVYYREIAREYWGQFLVYSGVSPDWTEIKLDLDKIYCPPLPIHGLQFILFCKDRNGAAVGSIRSKGAEPSILKFFASNQVETVIRVQFGQRISPAEIVLQLKTEPGSDAINLICVGHSDHPGMWNTLI